MNNMNEMICIMNNEVEDYDACDASSTRLRLRKLKALMDSSCYVYHLMEEEMKTIKCIERFDISKMNRLCPDVERHILGFIGNPCETIKGYAEYLWEKRGKDYTTGAYGGKLKWSLNMKKLYIIKNVCNQGACPYHLRTSIRNKILRSQTKTIDDMMSPLRYRHLNMTVFYKIGKEEDCVKRDKDYKRLEWLNNKWKANPKKIERLATAEVKRLKENMYAYHPNYIVNGKVY